MKDKVYDFLKKMCTTFLPATATLYVTLAQFFPEVFVFPDKIAGVITAICYFIGTLIGVYSVKYWENKEIIDKEKE